ncbi:MAG: glycine--tRNA ligase subunit beta [bacterium]|jgi:glycyl-tRNA synthetase beta chain|nr:glycine--tRNA ligase subunit beta [Bacillota bacterium]
MPRDLLLEIGTEEIPARFMPATLEQLKTKAQERLAEARLDFSRVQVTGTPRRLVLHVHDLADRATDLELEIKGPPKKVAFDAEGKPTKAALGFARNQGIEVSDLVVKEVEGGEYVFACVRDEGQPAKELLSQLLPDLILSITFPKTMRWGDGDLRFARPIHWLLALLGEEVIPFSLAGVESGRETYGHRFLSKGPISIGAPGEYYEKIREHYVIVDPEERKRQIRKQCEELARQHGGKVLWDEDLLEEIIYLVEYPTALVGSFKADYLDLPMEVVITPMKEHQRYFPLADPAGELLPLFITVRNGTAENLEIVREGNEKVLQARLADAKFFYEEDKKVPLADRVERLKNIVFLEGLGSIYDKVERVRELALFIVEELGLEEPVRSLVDRTVLLSKADLTTNMVYEFDELQGVMGREYALLDGENPVVAQGIYEHYLPRFAGDELPQTMVGNIASIADKLDSICGCFGIGIIPTGSADPYALRRQAYGIVNILLGADLNLELSSLVDCGLNIYRRLSILKEDLQGVREQILDFFAARIKNACRDRGAAYDSIDAVLAVGFDNVAQLWNRLEAVEKSRRQPEFPSFIAMFNRVHNLARQAAGTEPCNPALFQEEAEKELYASYQELIPQLEEALAGQEYTKVLEKLFTLQPAIDRFFDDVLVMAKEEEIKNNRLALLREIDKLFLSLADFSKIVTG